MNSILQCLTHNPAIRNFFMRYISVHLLIRRAKPLSSDGHSHARCSISQDSICIACETDHIISKVQRDSGYFLSHGWPQFHNGDTAPITPHRFLHSVWSYAVSLAGYAQQDAHEFLMFILNALHTQCKGLW